MMRCHCMERNKRNNLLELVHDFLHYLKPVVDKLPTLDWSVAWFLR